MPYYYRTLRPRAKKNTEIDKNRLVDLRLYLVEFSFRLGEHVFKTIFLLLQSLVLTQSLVKAQLHLRQSSFHRLLGVAAVTLELRVQLLADLLKQLRDRAASSRTAAVSQLVVQLLDQFVRVGETLFDVA